MQAPIVVLDGITKRFGTFVAVDHISLEIQEGEFITLLGPSGCGKTTTLRMLAGFVNPDEGRVFIGGEDVTHLPPEKRPVNMVFQKYALFPHLNVYDNIAFGPSLRKVPDTTVRQDIDRLLALVRLEGYQERRVNELSGGQAQRVALARALINQPKVLLLDEPLGALDLKLRKQMQIELTQIQRRLNTTFVYVTHDQEEALVMSDRVVVMESGRIAQVGSGREIYERPRNAFVSGFVGDTNLAEGKVVGLEGDRVLIDAEGLQIAAARVDGLRVGLDVWVSVRPEAILMLPSEPGVPCDNAFSAEIVNVIFLGPLIKYQLCLPNGHALFAETTRLDARVDCHMGDHVTIQLPLESLNVMLS